MTITYKSIEIYGTPEKRTCPVCSTCRRVFHPSFFPNGLVSEDGEAWTCSVYCAFNRRHGEGALQSLLRRVPRPSGKKEVVKSPEMTSESILDKYKSIPGASWADEE